MEFWTEFLPNQTEYRRLHGPEEFLLPTHHTERALFSFLGSFNGFADYSGIDLEIPKHMPVEKMASNPVTMAFLQFLVAAHQPKKVLELGTYIGVSAIMMSKVMSADGIIVSVEKGEEFHRLAERNCLSNAVGCLISIMHADALSGALSGAAIPVYDMIFLDCDKENYDKYLAPLQSILRPDGLLVVDDVLFHGDVLNDEPTTEKGKGCKRLLEAVKKLDWPKVLLPIGNGILLLKKPRTAA